MASWPTTKTLFARALAITALGSLAACGALAGERGSHERCYDRIELGGLFYFSYQHGETAGDAFSRGRVKRGHLDVRAEVLPYLDARFTTDVKQDPDDDLTVRVKYAFGRFRLRPFGPVREPWLEVGQVRLPWIFFEESIYRYRLQDGTFMDRLGLTSSADRGLTFGGLLGAHLPETYRDSVNPRLPGRWGSFAVGVYDGGGFKANEENTNKVIQGRLSLRPFANSIPGLQISSLVVRGRGNSDAAPQWELTALMLSWETSHLVATAQALEREGDPGSLAVDEAGTALCGEGWSLFAEWKLSRLWSLIGRQDAFDPDVRVPRDSWHRTIAGIARHLGGGNLILLDWERRVPVDGTRLGDDRLQITLQMTL